MGRDDEGSWLGDSLLIGSNDSVQSLLILAECVMMPLDSAKLSSVTALRVNYRLRIVRVRALPDRSKRSFQFPLFAVNIHVEDVFSRKAPIVS